MPYDDQIRGKGNPKMDESEYSLDHRVSVTVNHINANRVCVVVNPLKAARYRWVLDELYVSKNEVVRVVEEAGVEVLCRHYGVTWR